MKKTVRVSNTQVLTIVDGLNKMKDDNVNLPALLAYALVKNIRALEPTYNTINETKNILINKHQKTKEGIKQGTKEFDSFIEEFAPVLRESDEFELEMIASDMLEGLEFSMADMLALEVMIED